jgi:hypothetical protein
VDVAVKSLHPVLLLTPAEVDLVKREAYLMSLLWHPHVLQIYGVALSKQMIDSRWCSAGLTRGIHGLRAAHTNLIYNP